MTAEGWIALGALIVAIVGTGCSVLLARRAQTTAGRALELAEREHRVRLSQDWRLVAIPFDSQAAWEEDNPRYQLHLVSDLPAKDVTVSGSFLDLATLRYPHVPANGVEVVEISGYSADQIVGELVRLKGADLRMLVKWTDAGDEQQHRSLTVPPPIKDFGPDEKPFQIF